MISKEKLMRYLLIKQARVPNAGFMNKNIMGTTLKKMLGLGVAGAVVGTALGGTDLAKKLVGSDK